MAARSTFPPGVDPLALEEQVCFALSVAARSVVGVYRPVLEPLGLTHPQYLVMLALWQRAPVRASELSRLLQLDPGTLSPLLKRLERAGLVVRGKDPTDDRALALDLTDEGRALRERALDVPGTIVERLGMSLDDLRALHRSLTEVIAAAQEPGQASGHQSDHHSGHHSGRDGAAPPGEDQ